VTAGLQKEHLSSLEALHRLSFFRVSFLRKLQPEQFSCTIYPKLPPSRKTPGNLGAG
jgi:hypothetical protein